ncbi:MAG: glycosyltransferase family 2 protein, partial [Candidatus Binatia bacterium]
MTSKSPAIFSCCMAKTVIGALSLRPWHQQDETFSVIANNLSPAITIVIPVRNEAPFIDRCLRSVFSSDPIPGGMEVVVVDGMSTDGTRQLLEEWCRTEGNMTVLDNPDGIAPTAMNIGIRAARGRWIIILGAHAEYPRNYLTLCLRTIRRTNADNVGGGMITLSSDDNLQGKLVRALTTHFFGVGNAGFRLGANEGPADTVVFSCCRREVFERIGLFDERLARNQDYEFNRRLLRAGGSIWH